MPELVPENGYFFGFNVLIVIHLLACLLVAPFFNLL